jgi:ABC-2 type transport system permease protein
MSTTLLLLRKELRSYFVSPFAYIVAFGFLSVSGLLFWLIISLSRIAGMESTLANMAVVLLLVCPALTMRQIAEERRSGTIELLLTLPTRDWQIALAKFLASLTLLSVMLGLTLVYPLLLIYFGEPDIGRIATGYLGIFLLSGSFLAIGLFASSLTRHQVVAAVLSFGFLLSLWFCNAGADLVGSPLNQILLYLSFPEHLQGFFKGVLDTADIAFFVILTVLFVVLSSRSLTSHRWG